MQVEIKLDPSCKEPRVIVVTNQVTDEINEIVQKLSNASPNVLAGFQGENAEILELAEIYRIYAESGKIFAVTQNGRYTLRLRLYELEDRLDRNYFVRISNSEIINLKKVKDFDLSFAGTICVNFSNGMVSYVSRRYVTAIKHVLGM